MIAGTTARTSSTFTPANTSASVLALFQRKTVAVVTNASMATLEKRIRTKGIAGSTGDFSPVERKDSTRITMPAAARSLLRMLKPFSEVVAETQHGRGVKHPGNSGDIVFNHAPFKAG